MYAKEMKTIGGLKGSLESIDASASSPTESKSTAFAEVKATLDACVDACAKGDTKGDTKGDAKGDTGSVEIANTEIQSQKQNVVTAAAAHAEIVPRINEPIREDVSRELPKKNAVSVDSPEKDLNDKNFNFPLGEDAVDNDTNVQDAAGIVVHADSPESEPQSLFWSKCGKMPSESIRVKKASGDNLFLDASKSDKQRPLSVALQRGILEPLMMQCKLVDAAATMVMYHECDLKVHLQSLRDYMLLGKAEVFTAFGGVIIDGVFAREGESFLDFSNASVLNRALRGCAPDVMTDFMYTIDDSGHPSIRHLHRIRKSTQSSCRMTQWASTTTSTLMSFRASARSTTELPSRCYESCTLLNANPAITSHLLCLNIRCLGSWHSSSRPRISFRTESVTNFCSGCPFPRCF